MVNLVNAEGIDFSSFQDGLDWKKAAKRVQYAWLKVSEGATFRDKTYSRNQTAARATGIPVGGYHWAHPELHPDPSTEADNFLGALTFKPGDLRPALDFEEPKAEKLGAGFLEAWALGWLAQVEQKLGVKPIIYVNPNWLKSVLAGAPKLRSAMVDVWLADYGLNDGTRHKPSSVATKFPVVAHQYTSKGKVSGWNKPLDRNFAPNLELLLHQPPAPPAKAQPPWIAMIGGKPVKGELTDPSFVGQIRSSLLAGRQVTLRPRKAGE
jgi:lysozyme